MAERKTLPINVRVAVLTEAGYRCAVPTCRTILAIDIHHIFEVSEGGGDDPVNLLALCPTCHALFHRGTIRQESIRAWKMTLMALNHAFDHEGVDNLLFLQRANEQADLRVTGDGVLKFSRLIAAGLASYSLQIQNGPLFSYKVDLTPKGQLLLEAWKSGNTEKVREALTAPLP